MSTKTCSICLEDYPPNKVSHCLNCLEAGVTCHECEKKWLEAGNDTLVCSVCKQQTKKNVQHVIIEIQVPVPTQTSVQLRPEMDWVMCKLIILLIILVMLMLLMGLLIVLYCINYFS